MSVTISQTLTREISYPDLGVTVPGGSETVDVTYTAESINSFDGTNVTALYAIEIGGKKSPYPHAFTFRYSGSGNPLDEAEPALEAELGA
ncbi:hypothetical protein DMT41_00125 [Klebsiella variicola]|uniref:hypothetical protein n=1 Tax=Klebsiella variicola TaxID=244366 RepID=UPI000D750702|nr:hypothetical protein [Klebsiella variicola]PXH65286.1 hypothetical protein DMT41_00125 [Klebsiella variicola]